MLEREDYELIKKVEYFLRKQSENESNSGGTLWTWALKVPHEERLEVLFKNSGEAFKTLKEGNSSFSVLDLGCGFCTYWPFFERRGCDRFVGVDLFTLRGQGDQAYQETATRVAKTFCKKSSWSIFEGDARDIDTIFQESEITEKFDVIFTKNTDYKKLGSTGIPEDVFNSICDKWLKEDGTRIYAG
jgi:hypothetical protein|tara:strand:- start:152 stop:712 length:561 start_codon:yes stop_codon:yes gene_type:complete